MQIETVNNKCEKISSHGRGKMSKQTGHGGKGGRGGPDGELAPPPRTQGTVTWGWIQYSTVPYCQMRCVDVAPSLGEGPWLCRSTSHAQVRASASSSGPAPGTRSTSAHIRTHPQDPRLCTRAAKQPLSIGALCWATGSCLAIILVDPQKGQKGSITALRLTVVNCFDKNDHAAKVLLS